MEILSILVIYMEMIMQMWKKRAADEAVRAINC